jgi:hypothetical protein
MASSDADSVLSPLVVSWSSMRSDQVISIRPFCFESKQSDLEMLHNLEVNFGV